MVSRWPLLIVVSTALAAAALATLADAGASAGSSVQAIPTLDVQTRFTVDSSASDLASPNCNDSKHSPPSAGACTLREAINRANAINVVKYGEPAIRFKANLGTIYTDESLPWVTNPTSISGIQEGEG